MDEAFYFTLGKIKKLPCHNSALHSHGKIASNGLKHIS